MSSSRIAGPVVLLLAAAAAADDAILTTECVTTDLTFPVRIAAAPGDESRLFVVEAEGKILVVDLETGDIRPEPLLDISEQIHADGDGRLYGLAFHPGYAQNGHFYVCYAGGPSHFEQANVVARYTATPNSRPVADPATEHVVLEIDHDDVIDNGPHTCGWLGFGPEGNLYVAFGDCNAYCEVLNLSSKYQVGRILRLDVDGDDFPADPRRSYAIPSDNPFVGDGTATDETWVYGLKTPWGISFDQQTGDLFIGDVGVSSREEIEVVPAGSGGGQNFGWPCIEGSLEFSIFCGPDGSCGGGQGHPTYMRPVYEYAHPPQPQSVAAVIGGTVYRGSRLTGHQGRYFFADYGGQVFSFRYENGEAIEVIEHTKELDLPGSETLNVIVGVSTDAAGELYILRLHDGSGSLLRIVKDTCPQDTDDSGTVDAIDLAAVLTAWGTDDADADVTDDGHVDIADLVAVLTGWGPC